MADVVLAEVCFCMICVLICVWPVGICLNQSERLMAHKGVWLLSICKARVDGTYTSIMYSLHFKNNN